MHQRGIDVVDGIAQALQFRIGLPHGALITSTRFPHSVRNAHRVQRARGRRRGTTRPARQFCKSMEQPALQHIDNKADRRTELAADRTVLAAERSYAAWMRTGLGALAS